MKTVFVSEYLCSGAWPEEETLPESLIMQGRSMLQALCEDFLSSRDFTVYTTCDQRVTLNPVPGLEIIEVDSPAQEWETFQKLAKQCDATLVIAPELDQILTDRIAWLEQNDLNQFMSTAQATQNTADKFQFYKFCQQHSIPTPPTFLLQEPSHEQTQFPCSFPFVIKPQFGAGTTMTAVIRNLKDWQRFSTQRTTEADFPPYLIQPMLSGEFVSITCIISADEKNNKKNVQWFPIAQQRFKGLEYSGGTIPYQHELNSQVQQIAKKIVSQLTGLRGYISFDFVLNPIAKNPVQILEINPRLTTSYLGYRALTKQSLAFRQIDPSIKTPIQWTQQTILFDPQGNLSY